MSTIHSHASVVHPLFASILRTVAPKPQETFIAEPRFSTLGLPDSPSAEMECPFGNDDGEPVVFGWSKFSGAVNESDLGFVSSCEPHDILEAIAAAEQNDVQEAMRILLSLSRELDTYRVRVEMVAASRNR